MLPCSEADACRATPSTHAEGGTLATALMGGVMTKPRFTATGIAYERAGPRSSLPLVLVHAGVADRSMWDALWPRLTQRRDTVRLDLRGFGDSVTPPSGTTSPVVDLLDTAADLDIDRCHIVGASFGAGVAVEAALSQPKLVESLLLVAPGGSLLAEATTDLRSFFDAEGSALQQGDLDRAVEANLACWVDGPRRGAGEALADVREAVRRMQRRAFDVTVDWQAVEDDGLLPPALERLHEVLARTLVLVGELDLDVIAVAAATLVQGVVGARRIDLPGVGHLPSMERPDLFLELLDVWLDGGGEADFNVGWG